MTEPIQCLDCGQELHTGQDYMASCPKAPTNEGSHRLTGFQLMVLGLRTREAARDDA